MGMNSVILTLSGMTASATGVSLSQSVPGAAGVVIDGAYNSGYSATYLSTAASVATTATLTAAAATTLVPARQIVIVSAGNDSAKTFTVKGLDVNGAFQSETLTGANASRTATTKFFAKVTEVSISSTSAGNVSVGINGIATITQPRRVSLTSGGVDTGITFTVKGTDVDGAYQTEVVTGASSTAAYTKLSYKTVTSIVASGATASTLTAGSAADSITNGPANSRVFIPDQFREPFNIGIGTSVSGTATYSVQHTFSDVWNTDPTTWVWADNSGISAKTQADNLVSGNYAYSVSGIRINLTSGTGTVTCWLRQAGSQ